jgi:hypothetical protein
LSTRSRKLKRIGHEGEQKRRRQEPAEEFEAVKASLPMKEKPVSSTARVAAPGITKENRLQGCDKQRSM